MNIVFTNAILDEFKIPGYHRAQHSHDYACERLSSEIFEQLAAGILPENLVCYGTYKYAFLTKKTYSVGFRMQIIYDQEQYKLILRNTHAIYVQYKDGQIGFFSPSVFRYEQLSIYINGNAVSRISYTTLAGQYEDIVTYYPDEKTGTFRRVGQQGEVTLIFTPVETHLHSVSAIELCPQISDVEKYWQLQPLPTHEMLYSFLTNAIQRCNECFQHVSQYKK